MNEKIKEQVVFVLEDDNEVMTAALDSNLDKETKCSLVKKSSSLYATVNRTIAINRVAKPEKIAPTTKYGPNIVECHPTLHVMLIIQETTVWTDIATGIIT